VLQTKLLHFLTFPLQATCYESHACSLHSEVWRKKLEGARSPSTSTTVLSTTTMYASLHMWIVARVSLDYFSLKFSYSSNPLLTAISSLWYMYHGKSLSGKEKCEHRKVEGHTLPTRHYTRLPRNLQSHLNSTDSEGCLSSTEPW
jgi:hypothetical protein